MVCACVFYIQVVYMMLAYTVHISSTGFGSGWAGTACKAAGAVSCRAQEG